MMRLSAVLAELPFCQRCLNQTHMCAVCQTTTSHGYTICPGCDNQLEQEAA